jgi:hypothetical protein
MALSMGGDRGGWRFSVDLLIWFDLRRFKTQNSNAGAIPLKKNDGY